jgi:hypothetical protein
MESSPGCGHSSLRTLNVNPGHLWLHHTSIVVRATTHKNSVCSWPPPIRTHNVIRDTHLSPDLHQGQNHGLRLVWQHKHRALSPLLSHKTEVRSAGRPWSITQSPDLHFHIFTTSWTRCSLRALPSCKFITMFQILLRQIFLFPW